MRKWCWLKAWSQPVNTSSLSLWTTKSRKRWMRKSSSSCLRVPTPRNSWTSVLNWLATASAARKIPTSPALSSTNWTHRLMNRAVLARICLRSSTTHPKRRSWKSTLNSWKATARCLCWARYRGASIWSPLARSTWRVTWTLPWSTKATSTLVAWSPWPSVRVASRTCWSTSVQVPCWWPPQTVQTCWLQPAWPRWTAWKSAPCCWPVVTTWIRASASCASVHSLPACRYSWWTPTPGRPLWACRASTWKFRLMTASASRKFRNTLPTLSIRNGLIPWLRPLNTAVACLRRHSATSWPSWRVKRANALFCRKATNRVPLKRPLSVRNAVSQPASCWVTRTKSTALRPLRVLNWALALKSLIRMWFAKATWLAWSNCVRTKAWPKPLPANSWKTTWFSVPWCWNRTT